MPPIPVLFIATAQDCGHCIKLHSFLPDVKRALANDHKVAIKELSNSSYQKPLDVNGWPADITRWVQGYPTIALFRGDVWESAARNTNGKLVGAIFNGAMDGDIVRRNNKYTFDKDGVMRWIQDNINALPTTPFESGMRPLINGDGMKASLGRDPISVPNTGIKNCSSGLRLVSKRH